MTAPSPPDVGSVESLTATSSETPAAGAFDDSSRTTAPGGDTLDEHAVAGDPTVTAAATGPPFGSGGTLADLLAELVRVATVWNPDGRASIAVVTPEGALHGVNENRPHLSASAVKPLWTAVAIVHAGSSAVAPFAQPTLAQSDNHAAGKVIDLIGIDTVNAWTRETAGLTGTHTACWNYGKARLSRSAIDGGGCANRTTAADLANFYARLGGNELLDPDDTAALEGWLRDTPRGSASSVTTAGALLARLPPAVAAAATHKAGWLPPNCCRNDHRLIVDAGSIPLPTGDSFSIAAVADSGRNYILSIHWVGYAACRVYKMLAGDNDHTCVRTGDRES